MNSCNHITNKLINPFVKPSSHAVVHEVIIQCFSQESITVTGYRVRKGSAPEGSGHGTGSAGVAVTALSCWS